LEEVPREDLRCKVILTGPEKLADSQNLLITCHDAGLDDRREGKEWGSLQRPRRIAE